MSIKELREAYGLTQQKLAEITRIPKRSIENWEGGQRRPPEYVEYLVEAFLRNRKKEGH